MMVQVPRTQKLWRVPYFQLLILFLECWIVVTNTKEIKRKERERREKKRKSYLRGFLFCAVMA
jgi:hypothetical protein